MSHNCSNQIIFAKSAFFVFFSDIVLRGLPEEDLSVLLVICPLFILGGLPGEDLSVCVLLSAGTLNKIVVNFDPSAQFHHFTIIHHTI